MREPIKPEDLCIGDKVRTESRDGRPFGTYPQMLASEWIVGEDDLDGDFEGVDLYLLDRSTPAVDLPTEPTLGWASNPAVSPLGIWKIEPGGRWLNQRDATLMSPVAFTPAVAVPKAALDELRRRYESGEGDPEAIIDPFLTAIDAANGDPR